MMLCVGAEVGGGAVDTVAARCFLKVEGVADARWAGVCVLCNDG